MMYAIPPQCFMFFYLSQSGAAASSPTTRQRLPFLSFNCTGPYFARRRSAAATSPARQR
jgi:hypothetical protein